MAVEGRSVIGTLVAEQLARPRELPAAGREDRVVVVADLVPQVAEHRSVGLLHLLAHRDPVRVVGLGEVERHDPVGVAGRHRLDRAREQIEGELVVAVARLDREAQLAELEQQPPLRRLGDPEGGQTVPVGVGGAGASERAREAEPAGLLDEPVAAGDLGVLAPVERLVRSLAGQRDQPVAARLEREQRASRPFEAELGVAVQAAVVLEEDLLAAVVTGEGAHRAGQGSGARIACRCDGRGRRADPRDLAALERRRA